MKTTKLSLLAILIASSSTVAAKSSIISMDDTNPFDENAILNQMVEPQGLLSYSFNKSKNSILNIDPDRQYIHEAQQTKMFGKVLTNESRVNNLGSDIKERLSLYNEEKLKFTQSQINKGIKPSSINLYRFEKTTAPTLISVESALPKARLLNSFGSGTYIEGKGWDTVVSILNDKKLGNIIIERWNYKASNGGVILDSDAVNTYVMGNPGILIIRDSGKNMESILSWVDDNTSYTIRADGDLSSQNSKDKLIELANLITIENLSGVY